MPTIYQKCDDLDESVRKRLVLLNKRYHVDLAKHEVTFDLLFAANPDSPPLKRQGVPCAAKVRAVPLKDRAKGNADIEICIDEEAWKALDDAGKDALLDHELEHCELQFEDNGAPKTDDLNRPKFKMKPHDFEVWGFASIIQRHGKKALEFVAAQQFRDKFGQLLMWAEDSKKVG